MRSQLWEDDGNSAPGRGIRECKDPEEERNLESVRVKGAGGWSVQARGQNQPAESTEEGRSSLPSEKLPLAVLGRTDCWGLGWEQEAREERREVKSDGGHSRRS